MIYEFGAAWTLFQMRASAVSSIWETTGSRAPSALSRAISSAWATDGDDDVLFELDEDDELPLLVRRELLPPPMMERDAMAAAVAAVFIVRE